MIKIIKNHTHWIIEIRMKKNLMKIASRIFFWVIASLMLFFTIWSAMN